MGIEKVDREGVFCSQGLGAVLVGKGRVFQCLAGKALPSLDDDCLAPAAYRVNGATKTQSRRAADGIANKEKER